MHGEGLSPPRITLGYVGIASLILGVAVGILPRVIATEAELVRSQAVTGVVGIIVTAMFVFLVTRAQQRTIDRAQSELTESRRLLDILSRVLRHNLRNDTNVIRGYTTVIRENYADERLDRYLGHVEDAVADIIDYATKAQRMATTETARTTLELPRVIASVVEDLRSEYPKATITTDFEGVGRVRANPNIDEAIAELVENAVVHSDREAPRVEVELLDAGERWRVIVRDDGPGIPEHEREVLRRGRETQQTHSSGVGLWFVYWVTTNSDGRIDIVDNDPRGSVVALTLPKSSTGPSPVERRLHHFFGRDGGSPTDRSEPPAGTDRDTASSSDRRNASTVVRSGRTVRPSDHRRIDRNPNTLIPRGPFLY